MIGDALTHGLALEPERWRRERRVVALAAQRGFSIPAVEQIAPGAPPARAFINYGRWVAWCPDCIGAAEDVWRAIAVFFCLRCGNASVAGAWRPVLFPPDRDAIEATLADAPREAQNWEPWAVEEGPPDA